MAQGTYKNRIDELAKSGRNIKCVFALIDMRHPATDFDISMLDFMQQMDIPYHIVLTKCDKLNKTQLNEACAKLLSSGVLRSKM